MIGQLRQMVEGKKNRPTRTQVLAARPLRNPRVEWSREPAREEGAPPVVLVRVPRRADRWGNFVARWFRLPDFKKIELDQIGSDVWELCDGTHNVDAIARAICQSYKLNKRQGETSVTAYLRMLAERRLIGLQTSPAPATTGRAKSGKKHA